MNKLEAWARRHRILFALIVAVLATIQAKLFGLLGAIVISAVVVAYSLGRRHQAMVVAGPPQVELPPPAAAATSSPPPAVMPAPPATATAAQRPEIWLTSWGGVAVSVAILVVCVIAAVVGTERQRRAARDQGPDGIDIFLATTTAHGCPQPEAGPDWIACSSDLDPDADKPIGERFKAKVQQWDRERGIIRR